MSTDEVHDVSAQSLHALIDAAPDFLVGEEREEAFDLSQDELVGVRSICQVGRLASQLRISGALCVVD